MDMQINRRSYDNSTFSMSEQTSPVYTSDRYDDNPICAVLMFVFLVGLIIYSWRDRK